MWFKTLFVFAFGPLQTEFASLPFCKLQICTVHCNVQVVQKPSYEFKRVRNFSQNQSFTKPFIPPYLWCSIKWCATSSELCLPTPMTPPRTWRSIKVSIHPQPTTWSTWCNFGCAYTALQWLLIHVLSPSGPMVPTLPWPLFEVRCFCRYFADSSAFHVHLLPSR